MLEVEIDKSSGFCFGVVTAIESAERELANSDRLYCLGDIVHNSLEVERLEKMGLRTIEHEEFGQLKGEKVLLRAHGEPPSTYEIARRNGIQIVDATCPVVLRLQRKIHKCYEEKIARIKEEMPVVDFARIERDVLLSFVNNNWIDHIDAMDQLRHGIGLRAYGQRDPVVEYRNEAFDMFEAMIAEIKDMTERIEDAKPEGTGAARPVLTPAAAYFAFSALLKPYLKPAV